mgnify:FL=1
MDYIQEMFAERIGGSRFGMSDVIYKFEKIKRSKREAAKLHPDMELIDLGVGQPDYMADGEIIRVLSEESAKWENRGYADNGIDEFKKAAAKYMDQVFGVKGIDYETETLHMIGSKAGLTILPQAFINPGDVTLITVPGYPVMGTITEWLGGEKYELPLKEEHDFYPDLDAIPENICKRAKLIYVNYPNNPTGQAATREFFEKLVAFAKKNHIIIVQDAAYAAICLDGQKPLSILSIDGAKDIAVEIHSLSKSYNMTGWRLGFAVGNAKIITALATVKDNFDAGQFKPIQLAGSYALAHPELTEQMNTVYKRRQKLLCELLAEKGFCVTPSRGTFYLYVKAPTGMADGTTFAIAEDFSQYMIREKMISVVPWDDAGHYVRFSLTFHAPTAEIEKEIMDEVRVRLADCEFVFEER